MKFDLRRLPKNRIEITDDLRLDIEESLSESLGSSVSFTIDVDTRELTLKGRDERNILRIETWDLRDYISTAKEFERLNNRIIRTKDRKGIQDAYDYGELSDYIHEKSNRNSRITGLKNRVATMQKVLNRDDRGLNKLELRAQNDAFLREIKYKSFEDHDIMMGHAGIDISKYRVKLKDGSYGRFKSKRLEKEYKREFTNIIFSEYEGESEKFFGWMYEKHDIVDDEGEPITLKEYLDNRTIQEIQEEYREYIAETFDTVLHQAEASEDNETLERMKELRRTLKSRGN